MFFAAIQLEIGINQALALTNTYSAWNYFTNGKPCRQLCAEEQPGKPTRTHTGFIVTVSVTQMKVVYKKLVKFVVITYALIHNVNGKTIVHIDGLVQQRRNSSASAVELRFSCV